MVAPTTFERSDFKLSTMSETESPPQSVSAGQDWCRLTQ